MKRRRRTQDPIKKWNQELKEKIEKTSTMTGLVDFVKKQSEPDTTSSLTQRIDDKNGFYRGFKAINSDR